MNKKFIFSLLPLVFIIISGCVNYDNNYFLHNNTVDKSWRPSAIANSGKFTIITGYSHVGGGKCHPIIIIGHAFFVLPMKVVRTYPDLEDSRKTEFDFNKFPSDDKERRRLWSVDVGSRSVAIDLDQDYAYIMHLGYEFKVSKLDGRISWIDYDENANIYYSKVIMLKAN